MQPFQLQVSEIIRLPIIGFATLLLLAFTSCGTHYKSVTTRHGDHKIYNVSYGSDKKQVIDVFIPKEVATTDFAIIIHGGAWSFGNKRNIRMTQRFLMKNGIPSANINYRLASREHNLDDQISDISSVIALLDRDLPKAGLDPQKYSLIGESSGGHLALLYGYTHPDITEKIIALFPPTDFTAEKGNNFIVRAISLPIMKNLLNGDVITPQDTIEKHLRKASPINNISNIPTLILQGSWDFIVHPDQAKRLDSALSAKKVPHKLVMIDRATHFMRLNPHTRKRIIYPEMLNFMFKKQH